MIVWPSLTQVPDYNQTVFSIKYHWLFPDKSILYRYIRVKLIYLKSGRPTIRSLFLTMSVPYSSALSKIIIDVCMYVHISIIHAGLLIKKELHWCVMTVRKL